MIHFSRIYHLLIKEISILLNDHQVRFMMVGPPIIQLMIFSYAATLELNHLNIAIVNHDNGALSHDLVHRFAAAPYIQEIFYEYDLQKVQQLMDEQKILAAVVIEEDFSQKYQNGQGASIQLLTDGRKANASQIFLKYLQNMVDQMIRSPSQKEQLNIRFWFNENLLALWTTVPALVVIIAMLMGLLITGLSIAREREMGTLDALLVSPIRDYEILIAKAIPAVMIGVFQSLLMALAGVFILNVPFRGAIFTLLSLSFCFVCSIVGLGLTLSAFAKNQQQAIIGVFLLMVPCVTLSGYAAPIENMPKWMQILSMINPLKYGLIGSKAIFLKKSSFITLGPIMLLLLIMGAAFLALALALFRKKRRSL